MGIATIVGGAVGLIGSSQSASAMESAAEQSAQVQWDIFEAQQEMMAPWLDAGEAALNELSALYGLAPPQTVYYDAQGNQVAAPTVAPTTGAYTTPSATYTMTGAASQPPVQGMPTWQQAEQLAFNAVSQTYPDNQPTQADVQYFYDSLMSQYNAQQEMAGQPVAPGGNPPAGAVPGQLPEGYTTQTLTPEQQQQAAIEKFYASPEYQLTYQNALAQGTEALDRAAAASGMVASGAQTQALTDYTGGLANQTYNMYRNSLSSMAGVGQTTATTLGGYGANVASNVGNAYMAGGQAQAAGTLGMTNTLASGLNNYSMYNAMGGMPQTYGAPAPMPGTSGMNYFPTEGVSLGYLG